MGVTLPSDIVFDVSRSVDPSTLEVAREQLARSAAARSARTETTAFADMTGLNARFGREAAPAPATEKAGFEKFEGMVLSTFMQTLLPQEATAVYGDGMSGEIWKSFMAEKLGAAMAERGGIGIADRVLSAHYASGDQRVPVRGLPDIYTSAPAETAAAASSHAAPATVDLPANMAAIEQAQRKVIAALSEDRYGNAIATPIA